MSVVVIGAGIIGLSCAVEVQKVLPSAKVTLIADQFSPDTVSDVAAGQWRPMWAGVTDITLLRKWGIDTFKLLQSLYNQPDAVKYGVGFASGFDLQEDVEEICKSSYDIIINATGLGSFWLTNDKECFPIRGQIYKVKAPFQKHFVKTDHNYVLLNNDQVILGGCHQVNDFRTSLDESDGKRIWDGCLKLVPALKDCKVVGQYTALRPGRSKIRLELEYVTLPKYSEEKPVIHCYGHSGSGITLFYGCAKDVAHLCKSVLNGARCKL